MISRGYELVIRIKTIEVGLEELVGNEVGFERYIVWSVGHLTRSSFGHMTIVISVTVSS